MGNGEVSNVFFEFKTYIFFTLFRTENYGASLLKSLEHVIFLEDHAALLKEYKELRTLIVFPKIPI